MNVARLLLMRALFAALLVLAVSSAALLLTLLAPGDFTVELAGEQGAVAREALRQELGLDRPLLEQYADWLSRAVRFDFGTSLLYRDRPVADLVGERAANTAVLASAALAVATLVGLPLGVYTGMRPRGLASGAIRGASLVMLSTPPLVAALLGVLVAARTGWLPVGGMESAGAEGMSWGAWLADVAWHVPLPALALALPFAATLERLQSQSLREVAASPFVRAAQARGLGRDRALLTHGWRVSLGPVLGLYGLMIGTLFSGSFIVEVITAWPGLGRLMYEALRARDLYLVAGCAAMGAVFLVMGALLSDLVHAAADPRVRPSHR